MPLVLAVFGLLLSLQARPRGVDRNGTPTHGLVRRLFKNQSVGHQIAGVGYRVADSYRGIKVMVGWFKWIDRDLHRTKDGVLVVNHWLFNDHFTLHGKRVHGDVEDYTLAQVREMTSPGGYVIHTLEEDVRALAAYGHKRVGAVIEPKRPTVFRTVAEAEEVRALYRRYGVPLRAYALIQNRANIPFLRAAGIPTKALDRH